MAPFLFPGEKATVILLIKPSKLDKEFESYQLSVTCEIYHSVDLLLIQVIFFPVTEHF